ncbi:MAG TPA: hypothetical protein VIV06_00755 [Candidatus Limnocylindrales bacterium]
MDPIGVGWGVVHSFVGFFSNLVPGGFGLLLIPLALFGIATLLAARRS